MPRLALGLAAAALVALAPETSYGECRDLEGVPAIGVATLLADATIVLDLNAVSQNAVGHGRLVYAPGDAGYAAVREHLGDIEPGETCFVAPWSEEAGETAPNQSQ